MRNYWVKIQDLPDRINRHKTALYRCLRCNTVHRRVVSDVENGRTHQCRSCRSRTNNSQKWVITKIGGEEIEVVNLKRWCLANSYHYAKMNNLANGKRDKPYKDVVHVCKLK